MFKQPWSSLVTRAQRSIGARASQPIRVGAESKAPKQWQWQAVAASRLLVLCPEPVEAGQTPPPTSSWRWVAYDYCRRLSNGCADPVGFRGPRIQNSKISPPP